MHGYDDTDKETFTKIKALLEGTVKYSLRNTVNWIYGNMHFLIE